MDKKKLEKRLTIGFQIFAVIGLIIIGFYLGKAYKARKVDNDTKEVIKDFGTKMDEFSMESSNKQTIKFNDKEVTIEDRDGVTYLNDKKVNMVGVMGGYTLKDVIILYTVGQHGSNYLFINKDLEEIPFDNKDSVFDKLELKDGKLEAIIYNYNDGLGYYIGKLRIAECGALDSGDLLRKYKDELEPFKDNVLTGRVSMSYDGNEIKSEYLEKETVWDRFGKDIEGTDKTYCVLTNE